MPKNAAFRSAVQASCAILRHFIKSLVENFRLDLN